MEYGIKELAKLSGLTTRTLRYYDEIGLLKPARVGANGYRYYEAKEIETLQQILFYRKRGFELKQIKEILNNPGYDILEALKEHLVALEEQKENIESLIQNVKNTLLSIEGEYKMSDKERFEGFKEELIKKNEAKYGEEIREKYGDESVNESYAKLLNMSKEKYDRFRTIEDEILAKLEEAVKTNVEPSSEVGKDITELHKEWLLMVWKQYSSDAHKGLALMYIHDERFKGYYDVNVVGCAEFLQKAIEHWA